MNQANYGHIICPECDSHNYPFADTCWLCHRELANEPPVYAAELVPRPTTSVWKIIGIILGSMAAAVALVIALIIALFVICTVVVFSSLP